MNVVSPLVTGSAVDCAGDPKRAIGTVRGTADSGGVKMLPIKVGTVATNEAASAGEFSE